MKTRMRRDARLLAMFCCLAVLPLAIWACTDAGDAPSGPTGPATRYDPRMDQQGATITATASNQTWAPGSIQGITAFFKDANGLPVEGAPLAIFTEAGFNNPGFAFNTNPTLTDGNGMASIKVGVPVDCPTDSYTFVIATYPAGPVNGPQARAYVHVVVIGGGGGGATISAVSVIAGSQTVAVGGSGQYIAQVTASVGCNPLLDFQFEGGLWISDVGGDFSETWTWNTAGTFFVRARAHCTGSATYVYDDPPYPVTVQ